MHFNALSAAEMRCAGHPSCHLNLASVIHRCIRPAFCVVGPRGPLFYARPKTTLDMPVASSFSRTGLLDGQTLVLQVRHLSGPPSCSARRTAATEGTALQAPVLGTQTNLAAATICSPTRNSLSVLRLNTCRAFVNTVLAADGSLMLLTFGRPQHSKVSKVTAGVNLTAA